MDAVSFEWIPDLVGFIRRRWRLIAGGGASILILAIVYLCVASSKYTAETTLLIDTQAAAPFLSSGASPDAQYANGLVESQVEVLQSDGLARAVVRHLHLDTDAQFLLNGHSLLGSLLGLFTHLFAPHTPASADSQETVAAELLLRMIKVKRVGLSFIINVDLTTLDPYLSAHLLNTLAEAYVDLGLEAKNNDTRRASDWLQRRIAGLHDQAVAADQAAQIFKARAHIIDTDKGLMSERHLGELNSQLVLARTRTADAKAKYERAEAILANGDLTGNVTDALQNEVVVHLREAYVDAAGRVAEWRTRYGSRHQAVLREQARMRDIQAQLGAELRRIDAGYLSEYRESQASEQDVERQLQGLSTDAAATNTDLVTLRALQSSADTFRNLYGNFLQRYTQAVQDESFPISEARIVTIAMPPLRQSWPKAIILLAGSAVLGLSFGFAIALVRDALDRGLRTASQVRATLGLNCLALIPAVPRLRTPGMAAAPTTPRSIATTSGIMRYAADRPLSTFGEAVRGLRVRLSQSRTQHPPAVIGCVSISPEEGKTTIATNFAFFLAQAGYRTLLIDWDVRKRSISRALAPDAATGFAEVLAGRAPLAEAIWRDAKTGLELLPLAEADTSIDLLERPATRTLIETLRNKYDYVVVDLPAMEAILDAQVAAGLTDGLLLIVEWGRTSQDVMLEWLNSGGIDERAILGVILNKVNMKMLRKYPAGASAIQARPREMAA